MSNNISTDSIDFVLLAQQIKQWGQELGLQQVGITDIELGSAEAQLKAWLEQKYHGSMYYMEQHGTKRSRPAELVPNTIRVISTRMNYLPTNPQLLETLHDPTKAYISRYALGRDYHKVLRQRLHKLAANISAVINSFNYRAFVDSAPVMEKPLAQKAGLGWVGKHTLILNREAGSWFFLGELYTNLPLPTDRPTTAHCGSCTACITICPTQAIIKPYVLDARRCISYLTIENKAAIPEEFRQAIGNRIFGCDDCQIACPWNKYAKHTTEPDFKPRHNLASAQLVELMQWTEAEFLKKTEGSAIRRATYEGWLRNIAVALGNAPTTPEIINALKSRLDYPSALVREHVSWALQQHELHKHTSATAVCCNL